MHDLRFFLCKTLDTLQVTPRPRSSGCPRAAAATAACLLVATLSTACVSLTVPAGTYILTATDASGAVLRTVNLITERSRPIYNVRNALCINHPGAVITMTRPNGEAFDSPHRCR